MRNFLLGLAYFLVYTTPIQVGLLLWVLWVVFSTDYTLTSLTGHIFLRENLLFLYEWIYSWFWNAYLNFWYVFPMTFIVILKLIINTWLGFWMLKKLKRTKSHTDQSHSVAAE
jgi:hypothetical protein